MRKFITKTIVFWSTRTSTGKFKFKKWTIKLTYHLIFLIKVLNNFVQYFRTIARYTKKYNKTFENILEILRLLKQWSYKRAPFNHLKSVPILNSDRSSLLCIEILLVHIWDSILSPYFLLLDLLHKLLCVFCLGKASFDGTLVVQIHKRGLEHTAIWFILNSRISL